MSGDAVGRSVLWLVGVLIFIAMITTWGHVIVGKLDAEREVLCRIEAALSERPPSTPKSEECK